MQPPLLRVGGMRTCVQVGRRLEIQGKRQPRSPRLAPAPSLPRKRTRCLQLPMEWQAGTSLRGARSLGLQPQGWYQPHGVIWGRREAVLPAAAGRLFTPVPPWGFCSVPGEPAVQSRETARAPEAPFTIHERALQGGPAWLTCADHAAGRSWSRG